MENSTAKTKLENFIYEAPILLYGRFSPDPFKVGVFYKVHSDGASLEMYDENANMSIPVAFTQIDRIQRQVRGAMGPSWADV